MRKLGPAVAHALMLAIVCAIAAYWGVRILTPPPSAAPPPLAAPPPREPDPMLTARMMGLVQQPAQAAVAANIQVTGLFAAGASSSAVLAVDGKPARAFVLGQEVAPGTRLVEVNAEGAVFETAAGRQILPAPARPAAGLATGVPARAFVFERGSLSAVAGGAAVAGAAAPAAPVRAQPGFVPPPPPPAPPRSQAPLAPADAHVLGQPATPPSGAQQAQPAQEAPAR